MAIPVFLAMTAAEIAHAAALPPAAAWMACHFSPYGTGLTNLPRELAAGSLLILNDRTPIHGHDPQRIAQQLSERVQALHCHGLLLDLERENREESQSLAEHLVHTLPCPVAVSAGYAQGLDCPVFLPPVPTDVPLREHLAPWQGREIWLELALGGKVLTLTADTATASPLPPGEVPAQSFEDSALYCRYRITLEENQAVFTLWRTGKELAALLLEAEALGVTTAVGLYQELKDFGKDSEPSVI